MVEIGIYDKAVLRESLLMGAVMVWTASLPVGRRDII